MKKFTSQISKWLTKLSERTFVQRVLPRSGSKGFQFRYYI
uniref:Coat protein n=1 Tax=Capillovirus mali TaxID=28347 RepID=A0A0N9E511_9VIRU|nr:coat protein [Apple stem grooving virus]